MIEQLNLWHRVLDSKMRPNRGTVRINDPRASQRTVRGKRRRGPRFARSFGVT